PSSMIKVEIFRRSILGHFHLKNHLYTGKVARLLAIENNTALDLLDEKGDPSCCTTCTSR
ncbi:hypothetical protein PILCRDRAFT_817780, partial [Piloderma croceum F 1598]